MKDTEFAYAVGRVRANENKLLPTSVVESLINASDYKDALKILNDTGYGNFESDDEEKIFSLVLRNAFELIKTAAPDKECLDFLIIKNDFHNIKAAIKCLIADKSVDGVFMYPSVVEPEIIINALRDRDFSLLPENIGDIVKTGYELVTETMDGQALEIFLDKKCIEKSFELAEKSKDEFSISLAKLMCMISCFKIVLRCINTAKDESFLRKALPECSCVDVEGLCKAFAEGIDGFALYVKRIGFEKLSETISKGYASFEKLCDDMLIDKVKTAKYVSLGIAPLVAYYFAADAEIKTIRIILSCKKNGIDSSLIRERVRELYV